MTDYCTVMDLNVPAHCCIIYKNSLSNQKVRLYRLISINMVAVDTMSLLNGGGLVQVFLMMSWKRV